MDETSRSRQVTEFGAVSLNFAPPMMGGSTNVPPDLSELSALNQGRAGMPLPREFLKAAGKGSFDDRRRSEALVSRK